ncbi:M3 family oligoendopeptidase [Blautia hansenii]|uniref:Oligoendopeptidase, M3 family n=1 Tax=Blautia hansenii DSM 20583 TaxID=537007 RepID=C9L768_BLAHA|nr:M3 family oligoendopeptidase [Blautia hansenii]ASW16417.1 M3 family oligoendopeptidase [Blautia hansenii DSM 20583]EEX22262.1 oligoendopeptidase, M3 family [Blautia hansenii DSM 20583]UWO09708.1 M3 family oligoendopeptidase [Blautia hansenii DSM 20583]
MKFKDMPYERIDFAKAKAELSEIMEKSKAAKSGEEQFEIHKEFYQLNDKIQTQVTLCSIRHTIDTTDEFYEKEQNYYDEQIPEYSNMCVEYQKILFHSPYKQVLEEKIGQVAFKNMEIAMKSVSEEIIPLMQEENTLVTEYEKLLASAQIPWGEETLNLSLLTPYLKHKDAKIRREAQEKQNEFFLSIQDKLDELYDKLVKNRTLQAKKLGFETYTPLGYLRMQRNCYGREEIENLRRQVKEVWVPFAESIFEKRKERLGLSELSYTDEVVYSPKGNPQPEGTPEEILQAGQQMYEELSSETKEFFDFMMDNELLDVFGRKTKAVGGYMTYIPDYKSPFIFANFNGTSGDVDVMTHECGHAFQGYLAAADPIREHADIGMETAEIHSMSMEFFTEPWYPLFFGKETAQEYTDMHLEDAVIFVPYGCMVDEFQHIIYDNPNLTPKERKQVWKDLERDYKPHLFYDGLEFFENGCFWQKQHHIYSFPLYYIDYVIAQLCAFEYKIWMDKDRKAAWQSYLKLCRMSAAKFHTELLEEAGLETPFKNGVLAKIVENLKK